MSETTAAPPPLRNFVTVTIDETKIRVPDTFTVIQAAERLGIYIPRYCYHPGLPIAGSCRMCLVAIEKIPNLQISCYTAVREGMKIHTQSSAVSAARRSMLEFLLTDHPLDCPVCDQSGECDLQNFYMEYGQYPSRFLEHKIKRKKAVPIGPHVILDQERCILCTRCTRFCEEVSKTHELGVFNRGDRSVIDLAPGKSLDNPYSGNVIDICPVGALTEREFRFQCRVWYLSTQSSLCTGCARGCNVTLHSNVVRSYKARGRRLQRLKPRFNPLVNQWWMCDEGRFGHRFVDDNRIERPALRGRGGLERATWKQVLEEMSTVLQATLDKFGAESVGVVASPQLSNEELYLIHKLFQKRIGGNQIGFSNPWEKPGFEDDHLIRADKNPNRRGAQEIGFPAEVAKLLEKASSGEIKVLYVFQHHLDDPQAVKLLQQIGYLIYQGTNWNSTAQAAHLVLPSATHAEQDGTFTNFEGRIQRFQQALLPLAESRPGTDILLDVAERLGHPLPYRTPEDLFLEWQGKTYSDIDEYGILIEEGAGRIERSTDAAEA